MSINAFIYLSCCCFCIHAECILLGIFPVNDDLLCYGLICCFFSRRRFFFAYLLILCLLLSVILFAFSTQMTDTLANDSFLFNRFSFFLLVVYLQRQCFFLKNYSTYKKVKRKYLSKFIATQMRKIRRHYYYAWIDRYKRWYFIHETVLLDTAVINSLLDELHQE